MGEAEEGASRVYHVFINHRGPDTKKSVASLIFRSLIKYGLRVFLDQEELEAGDRLYDKIKSAIRSSSVHVAIFSVRYAESSWCLNELLDMLQSGRKVIPIFYDVKPGDLRHIENGCYADAFRNHQNRGRHDVELVERWKDALQLASNISGMEFNTQESDLGHLVDEIVEKVLKEAKWELLHVAEHPVGLRQAADDFNSFLKEKQLSGTQVVGIIGLDGSGKSTLVKHLYNCYLQSRKFKRYCFLSELNEEKLAVLQQKLLRDLLGHDKYSISDTTKGKRMLQTCLKGSGPVLIVLDGLDKEEQTESLLLPVKEDVLAEGSLILVTCHDKDLLKCHQVKLLYDVKLLQGKDAHDLFCLYAFKTPEPPKDLEELVKKFVKICSGFPLALTVLGRKLSVEQDRRYWKEQLKDLRTAKFPISIVEKILKALSRPKNIVDEILKVSYDYLQEKKKEVFLDVAHFLVGEDTDLAVRVLDGLHGSGLTCLKELESKCLLDLEEIEHWKRPFTKGAGIQWRTKGSSKIRMHDLVRKMATQIAIEDSRSTKPLRLCQLDNERIFQQLQSSAGHVRGIRWEYIDGPLWQDHLIKKLQLRGLRLLMLHHFRVPFPFYIFYEADLIWLRMRKSNRRNTSCLPRSLINLRVLEIDGVNFEALLDRIDGDKPTSELCELTVDYSRESVEIPERILTSSSPVDKKSMEEASSSASGTVLDWSSSRVDNKSMEEASSSARGSVLDWFRSRQLPNLVKMVLKNVKHLKSFPIDFKALKNLRHLDLSGWGDLEEMPDSFTGLLQLEYLALQDCRKLSISDLGGITKLEYLDFEGCSLLQKLPDKTTTQRELRYLNLMGTSITILPQDLGKLKKLEQLLITSPYLTSLPHSFHELGQLRILTLNRCPCLWLENSISIKHFPYLESLQLWDVNVTTLPQGIAWNNVKVLHVKTDYICEVSFERDQGELRLDRSHSQGSIHDRTKSAEATGHNRVSSLTELRLVETEISKLWFPPEESLFPDLEIVDLSGSLSLRDVQSLPSNLRSLYLMNCTALTTLPCLSNLACLRILDISGCHSLEALNLEGLRSIEEIAANDCWTLQSIQGLAKLDTLCCLSFSTSNEVPNSTIWSDILGFPSNASTVILGGANVRSTNAEEMDSVKQSILKRYEDVTISDIPTIENLRRVTLTNMGSYGAILLCVIAKQFFTDFKVSVGDNVYSICRPSSVSRAEVYEETQWAYTFMWSQNSNLFKDLTFQRKSVLHCTIEGLSSTLEDSITKAWITIIRNRTYGVRICKELLNSLC